MEPPDLVAICSSSPRASGSLGLSHPERHREPQPNGGPTVHSNGASTGAWSERRRRGRRSRTSRPSGGHAAAARRSEAADQEVVERIGRGRRAQAEARSSSSKISVSRGRRLRSPPKTSGAPPAHSSRRSAARSTSSLGRGALRARRRSRAGWRRRARGRVERRRLKAITRRSGRGPGRSGELAALGDQSAADQGQVRAALVRGDQIGVERGRASVRSGRERVAGGEHAMGLGAAVRARARAAHRGGHSCSSATSQSAPAITPANSSKRSRLTWRWVASALADPQQPRAPGSGARVGREIAAVEEVPGQGAELHPP